MCKRVNIAILAVIVAAGVARADTGPFEARRVTAGGATWQARVSKRTGAARLIYGSQSVPYSTSAWEAARSFIASNPRAFARVRPDSDLVSLKLRRGRTADRLYFGQFAAALPVLGAGIQVDIDASNRIVGASSTLVDIISFDDTVFITAAEAVRSARSVVPDARAAEPPRIVLYPFKGRYVAAYDIVMVSAMPRTSMRVIVDATTGRVLLSVDLLLNATGTGYIYNPNPALAPTLVAATLTNLDGTGYLKGPYELVLNHKPDGLGGTVEEVFDAGLVFNVPAGNVHLEEIMAYYYAETYRAYVNDTLGYEVNTTQHTLRVHDPSVPDNAYYDGYTGDFYFGDMYGSPGEGFAIDGDIVLHEYGHSVIDDLASALFFAPFGMAMHEGYADYLANSYMGDPELAEYVGDFYTGLGYLRTLANSKHYPDDLDGESHDDGEIWGGALWDLRQVLGGSVVDELVIAGAGLLGSQSTFSDGMLALVAADSTVFTGDNEDTIRTIFAARGITENPDDTFEPNDTDEEAAPIWPGTFEGLLCMDDDWYRIPIQRDHPLSARITFNPTALGDLDMALYTSTLMLVDESLGLGGTEEVTLATAPVNQDYYIRVFGYNGAINGYTLSVTAPGSAADLQMTGFAAPVEAAIGRRIAISYAVTNTGAATAGDFFIRFVISPDATIGPHESYISVRPIYGLDPGETDSGAFPVTISTTWTNGNYYIGAYADFSDAVEELWEDNNTVSQPIILYVDDIPPVATLDGPHGQTTERDIVFSFSADKPIRDWLYKFYQGSHTSVPYTKTTDTTVSFPDTPYGSYGFILVARDVRGIFSVPVRSLFDITTVEDDTVPPVPEITFGYQGRIRFNDVPFRWQANEPVRCYYINLRYWDGAATPYVKTKATEIRYEDLLPGIYTFVVTARDLAGNFAVYPGRRTFIVLDL